MYTLKNHFKFQEFRRSIIKIDPWGLQKMSTTESNFLKYTWDMGSEEKTKLIRNN